jgi:hypothetical protein
LTVRAGRDTPMLEFPSPTAVDRANGAPTRARTIAWCLLLLLALGGLVSVIVPLSPQMPEAGLDASWRMAMNHVVAERMAIGREVSFTLGPYVSLYTRVYHPQTDRLALGASLYLAASFWLGLILLGWRDRRLLGLAMLCATLALALHPQDSYLLAYPLLAALYSFHAAPSRLGSERIGTLAASAALFAPLGLLVLVKGSLAPLCVGIAALCAGHFLAHRRYRHAAVALVIPAIATIVLWVIAGQELTNLPRYFLSLQELTSGYSEAMSVAGPPRQVIAFALASALVAATIAWMPAASRAGRLFLLAAFSLALFVSYKAGFVRHDGHALIAGSAVLMAAMLLALSVRSMFSIIALPPVALCTLFIIHAYSTVTLQGLGQALLGTLAHAHRGVQERLAGGEPLRSRYEQTLHRLAETAALPPLQGAVDIYSFNQTLLLAAGLPWRPRPVFQSYAAYTPALARANRDHLLGPRAPDHLLFRVETIDGRLPAMDDGASWPAIIAGFRLTGASGHYLHLERRNSPGSGVEPRLETIAPPTRFSFDADVPVPTGGDAIFAKIDVRASLLGRLVGVLHKPSHLRMTVTLADGSARDFRIVSGMIREGVVLSPLIESTEDFAQLLASPARLSGKRIESFSIRPSAHAWQWHSEFSVEFASIDGDEASSASNVVLFDPRVDVPPSIPLQDAPRCDVSIDQINGSAATSQVHAGAELHALGWASSDARDGRVPEATVIVLTDAHGAMRFFVARPSTRPDVGAAFQQPGLAAAGFEARLDIRELPGDLQLRIALWERGELRLCPQSQLVQRP